MAKRRTGKSPARKGGRKKTRAQQGTGAGKRTRAARPAPSRFAGVEFYTPPAESGFEAAPVQAPHHPDDCPGCRAPDATVREGWPAPGECPTCPDGGLPAANGHAGSHDYGCTYWDHFPERTPF